MKKSCFAYEEVLGRGVCTALCEMICDDNPRCPFYKDKAKEAKKLLELHGTTDIDRIVSQYAISKGVTRWQ